MRLMITSLFALAATPALAAGDKPFFSLANTDFVVSVAFLIFLGILAYFKVPGLVGGMLDKRAESIKAELDEAKALRDEAQALLASYERKQKEVQEQADRIVAAAKEEATNAATAAKDEIVKSITRRLAAAEEQIASAQAAAIKDVRDQAIMVAVAAAKDVMAKQMDAKAAGALIDDAIATVSEKLH
ncbi:MAG: F0F1 ATP synthase subunit B [Yoonia sp.]|uniref:F0F1 ATP synthase subunit B n=1 Tax=Yoonia sp. TaxID=2212373 RepID=UPI00273FB0C4|nr:F0F1 ATP synthase subunit B [Yoonia sp.]MDP5085042.1 F0F1 ATP synthase subunit B [Yoonia sp.]MDP5359534.1 F0F1 ATP synthase subunit B [Paracoccaceae bacterium]MDP5361095.1 F0F1 ATP synthase subunit B [Paracoccaceae bacterium]